MLRIHSQNSHHHHQPPGQPGPSREAGMAAGKKPRGRNRNVVAMPMEVRGISSRNETHTLPLPEKPEDALPFPFIQTVSRALDSYSTPTTGEGSSIPDHADHHQALAASNNGWTTGNSTERSSLFSWGEDEFDKQSAKRVQRMFDEIDSMLYEGHKNSSTSSQLHNECKVWKGRFPHLRILGSQLLSPSDDGFQLFPQEEPTSTTTGVLLDIADHEVPGRSTHDRHGLTLAGHHIHPISSQVDMSIAVHASAMEEEVFAADGIVEEYFAYDSCRLTDEDNPERKMYSNVSRREGFPPLTPNACVHNTVQSQVFDVLWAEVVAWMRMLVKRHQEDIEKSLMRRPVVEPDQSNTLTPTLAPTFHIPLSPSPLGVTAGRLVEPHGKLAPMGSFRVGASASFDWQSSKPSSLTGVMTISSKALHTRQGEKDRAPSSIEEPSLLPPHPHRPSSSTFVFKAGGGRPTSTRMSDVHGHRMSSARGKSRLRPIERVKTPNIASMDALITGKKMMTANDRLSSPPHPTAASPPNHWSRNHMLPPIESVQENGLYRERESHRPPTSSGKRDMQRNRISSAVIDDRGQRPNRNLQPFPFNDSRPNTTHSFRSDMMLARRSSTPQNMANLLKGGLGQAQGAPLNDLGIITGRGINPGGLSQLEGTMGGTVGGGPNPFLKML